MLNNKQKSYLKGLANKERAIYHVGKEGISENIIRGIDDYLLAHELIKINLLKTCPIEANEIAIEVSHKLKADIVQIIGRTIIFYRQSKKGLIELP